MRELQRGIPSIVLIQVKKIPCVRPYVFVRMLEWAQAQRAVPPFQVNIPLNPFVNLQSLTSRFRSGCEDTMGDATVARGTAAGAKTGERASPPLLLTIAAAAAEGAFWGGVCAEGAAAGSVIFSSCFFAASAAGAVFFSSCFFAGAAAGAVFFSSCFFAMGAGVGTATAWAAARVGSLAA